MKSIVPAPPANIDAPGIMERLVDSIALRYELSSRGLTPQDLLFRPVESSMSIAEVMNHIHGLLSFVLKSIDKNSKYKKPDDNVESYRELILAVCTELKEKFKNMTKNDIANISLYLKRTDTKYSFWYMINGPLADALTHVGQINSWRRIAGNPCPRISPFTGEAY